MSFVSCFDTAMMVIDEASKKFKEQPDSDKLEIFENYCEAIDALSEEFDGESFEVEVNEMSKEISVTLMCVAITFRSTEHIFYELVRRSVGLNIYSIKGDLFVKFVFLGVWDKVQDKIKWQRINEEIMDISTANIERHLHYKLKTEEEQTEEFNALIEYIKEQAASMSKKDKACIINPIKIKEMDHAYKLLCYLTKETPIKVLYKADIPNDNIGTISMSDKNLIFPRPELFAEAGNFTSELEIYASVDGTVDIDFTFHELTVPIDKL